MEVFLQQASEESDNLIESQELIQDDPLLTVHNPNYKDCNCCKGFVYACADNSPACSYLGECGCTLKVNEVKNNLAASITESMEEFFEQEAASAERLRAPDKNAFSENNKNCGCCKGFVFACGDCSPACDGLGMCGCAYADLELIQSDKHATAQHEEHKSCQCCHGFIYACADNSPACSSLGVCGCTFSDKEPDEEVMALTTSLTESMEEFCEQEAGVAQTDPKTYLFVEKFKTCGCCKGLVLSCADHSPACASLGVCGCTFEED